MKKMKKTKIFLVALLSLFIFTTVTVYGDNITKTIQVTYRNISILTNGKQIQSEQEPFIYQGHTFVPLRTIGEALSKKVDWDNTKNQVIITDQINPDAVVRMDSFYSLMNYLPDNYKIEKTEEKLSKEDVIIIGTMAEKYLKIKYENFKFNYESVTQENYHLTSSDEDLILSIFYYKFEEIKDPRPVLFSLKYKDGKVYFIQNIRNESTACGCSDGWFMDINDYFKSGEYKEFLYINYLLKVNNSIVKDKPNRTKQLTLLNSIYLSLYLSFY